MDGYDHPSFAGQQGRSLAGQEGVVASLVSLEVVGLAATRLPLPLGLLLSCDDGEFTAPQPWWRWPSSTSRCFRCNLLGMFLVLAPHNQLGLCSSCNSQDAPSRTEQPLWLFLLQPSSRIILHVLSVVVGRWCFAGKVYLRRWKKPFHNFHVLLLIGISRDWFLLVDAPWNLVLQYVAWFLDSGI